MDLLVLLSFGTFAAVLVFAWFSRKRTKDKLESDNTETSTLARETPDPAMQPTPDDPDLKPRPEAKELRPRPEELAPDERKSA